MRRSFIFLLYRGALIAAFPFLVLYILFRVAKDRSYLDGIRERFGFLPRSFQRTTPTSIWLHAVSVGEILSAVELLRRIRAEMPWGPMFVSTTTVAGRRAAEQKLGGLVEGIFYCPFDYVFAVRGALRRIRPALVVILETEIWPNLYRETKRAGAGLAVVNGRISPKTAGNYETWRWFIRETLSLPDVVLTQDAESLEFYLRAGAPEEIVKTAGNLKYDFQPVAPPNGLSEMTGRPLWIAASTCAPVVEGDPDEDDVVITAYRELIRSFPDLHLAVAPRRPERFEPVARKLDSAGIPYVRRSTGEGRGRVLLLDSIGELSSLFGMADVVFMGGTLPRRGGHNILEPAAYGKAVVIGPHMENFPEVARRFRAGGAVAEITAPEELAGAVAGLLRAPERRDALGRKALEQAEAHRGATSRVVAELSEIYDCAIPKGIPPGPVRPALWVMARAWEAGSRRRFAAERLGTPVISVGGLSMGGSGKTPMVRWLAEHLGHGTVVLTRGYRRSKSSAVTLVPAGVRASIADTGDEAQLILRDGVAGLGIGAERVRVGRKAEERMSPSVFVLDDGFQHKRLHRDVDIVLLDGLDPLAGGDVFPWGRLREPPDALARATAVVITRAERGRTYRGLKSLIRQHNPEAPIFLSRPVAGRLICLHSGEEFAPDAFINKRVGGFCGLANPGSFWRTLELLGYRLEHEVAFPDHHRYAAGELSRVLPGGPEIWLTTEKDAVNLEESRPKDLPVYALRIRLEVEGDLIGVVRSGGA